MTLSTSIPDMPGIMMSRRMRSKRCALTRSRHCGPSSAVMTAKPRDLSRRDSMSRLSSLSSTTRSGPCRPPPWRRRRAWRGWPGYERLVVRRIGGRGAGRTLRARRGGRGAGTGAGAGDGERGAGEGRGAGAAELVRDAIDQGQEAARGLADALEVGRHLLLSGLLRVLVQHLAVADDLVDGVRRSWRRAEPGGGGAAAGGFGLSAGSSAMDRAPVRPCPRRTARGHRARSRSAARRTAAAPRARADASR